MLEAKALATMIATNLMRGGMRNAYDTPTTGLDCEPWSVNGYWLQFECLQKNENANLLRQQTIAWAKLKKTRAQTCLAEWKAQDAAEVARREEENRERQLEAERVEAARRKEEARTAAHLAELKAQQIALEMRYERCKSSWHFMDRKWIEWTSIEKVEQSHVRLETTRADAKREICAHMKAAAVEHLAYAQTITRTQEQINQHFSSANEGVSTSQSRSASYVNLCELDVTDCESGKSSTVAGRAIERAKQEYRQRFPKKERQIHRGEVRGS